VRKALDNPEFLAYAKTYYEDCQEFAREVDDMFWATFFDKIASPLNYLYEEWMRSKTGVKGLSQVTAETSHKQFNPETELKNHKWLGRKKEGGGHDQWDETWGWDRLTAFDDDVIEHLIKNNDEVTIGDYTYTLIDRIIQVKKTK